MCTHSISSCQLIESVRFVMDYLITVLLIISSFVYNSVSQPYDKCRNCEIIMNLAYHHFNNHINNEDALQRQLLRECETFIITEGPAAAQHCRTIVNNNIRRIFVDLSAGDSLQQTCVDIGECTGALTTTTIRTTTTTTAIPITTLTTTGISKSPQDCYDLYQSGITTDGNYTIKPNGFTNNVIVWCDMTNGGYTIIQRRGSGPDDTFDKNYTQYQSGFGNAFNYWLGLDNIYGFTRNRQYRLVVDSCCFNRANAPVMYDSFSIGDSSSQYRLSVAGGSDDCLNQRPSANQYSDNGGAFYALGANYVNPNPPQSVCLQGRIGGWWYGSCQENPNDYLYGPEGFVDQANCVLQSGFATRCDLVQSTEYHKNANENNTIGIAGAIE